MASTSTNREVDERDINVTTPEDMDLNTVIVVLQRLRATISQARQYDGGVNWIPLNAAYHKAVTTRGISSERASKFLAGQISELTGAECNSAVRFLRELRYQDQLVLQGDHHG